MTFGAVFVLAVGLAMDATAVSAMRGFGAPRILVRDVLLVALLFGGFQALMPLVGFLIGHEFGSLLAVWDHWIAFALLAALGGKMLWEARDGAPPAENAAGDHFRLVVLLGLALATSIDALAVGFTLPLLGAPFALSVATIGVTTAVLSALGLLAGRRFGALLGRRLDAFGGLVLIVLGVKILLEHLLA